MTQGISEAFVFDLCNTLHKICENTGFFTFKSAFFEKTRGQQKPVFSHILRSVFFFNL